MRYKSKIDYSLYLVTNREILINCNLEEAVEKAILGGTTLVQLREKNISTIDFYNIGKKIKKVTEKYNIPLIINDRLDIALAIDADGVHVGQRDMPVDITRKLIGENKILGVSASNITEALKAEDDGADYLGIGAIFPTDTKKDADYVTVEQLKEINEKVHIPSVAIGGINKNNVSMLKNTGTAGISIISAILGNKDIKRASEEIKKAFV